MKKVDLLIIDPLVDFCDRKLGSLYVEGADEDMKRAAAMIRRIGHKINTIYVFLDSHHINDIAHPIFWVDLKGSHPDPFTIITKDDVLNGKWRTRIPSLQQRALDYVTQLEANGKYPLGIWPYHGLIGSIGATVCLELFEALVEWEKKTGKTVNYITKGSNPYTEHYSAVKADVPDPADPFTQINTRMIQAFMESDIIVLLGEAGSHCIAETARDIGKAFGDASHIAKITFLEDAVSPVTGFKDLQDAFVAEMTAKGMQISNTVDFLK